MMVCKSKDFCGWRSVGLVSRPSVDRLLKPRHVSITSPHLEDVFAVALTLSRVVRTLEVANNV